MVKSERRVVQGSVVSAMDDLLAEAWQNNRSLDGWAFVFSPTAHQGLLAEISAVLRPSEVFDMATEFGNRYGPVSWRIDAHLPPGMMAVADAAGRVVSGVVLPEDPDAPSQGA